MSPDTRFCSRIQDTCSKIQDTRRIHVAGNMYPATCRQCVPGFTLAFNTNTGPFADILYANVMSYTKLMLKSYIEVSYDSNTVLGTRHVYCIVSVCIWCRCNNTQIVVCIC